MNLKRSFSVAGIVLMLQTLFFVSGEADNESLWQELAEIKKGIATGFADQWAVTQKLRYQGVKRQRGILKIVQEIKKLSQSIGKLKSKKNCGKDAKDGTKTGTSFCAAGMEEIKGRCYLIGNREMSWNEANTFCKSQGGYLFDGRDDAVFSEMRDYLKDALGNARIDRYLWVGGRNLDDGTWKWVRGRDGEGEDEPPVGVQGGVWASASEPRASWPRGRKTLCMALDASNDYKGVTTFCKHYRKFICSV